MSKADNLPKDVEFQCKYVLSSVLDVPSLCNSLGITPLSLSQPSYTGCRHSSLVYRSAHTVQRQFAARPVHCADLHARFAVIVIVSFSGRQSLIGYGVQVQSSSAKTWVGLTCNLMLAFLVLFHK